MKTIRIICLLLAAVALTLCAACDSSAPDTPGTEATNEPAEKTLQLDMNGFIIVRSDLGSKEEADIAVQLRRDLEEISGLKLEMQTDWVKRGEEAPKDTAEINIGNTTRRRDDSLRIDEWSIAREGNRVYIIGGSEKALAEAEAHFAENYLLPGGCSLKDGFSERHTVDYPIKSIRIGDAEIEDLVLCDVGDMSNGKIKAIASLISEKTGVKVSTSGSAAKSNIVATRLEGYGVDKGNWGLSVTDGKLYIIGRTNAEIKKAFGYLSSMIESAQGTLEFKNENGKAYVHTEKQMTPEEYRLQKQLVIYPEYPEMINRSYDYAVSVTMDKDTRSIPVYDHVMENRFKSRALNGDLHRRFSQFAFSGGQVRVDVKVKTSFKTYTVAPSGKGFKNEFKDGVISVWLDKPDYFFIMLDDDLNSIVSVFADYPEFPDEIPDKDDPNALYVEGVYKTENGFLDILNQPGYTVYIAPGSVLNCRVNISGNNTSVIGHGAMVDPFENIYDYDVTAGGQESKGHTFLNMNGSNSTIDGPVMLDAHCYNITIWGGTNNNIRNTKILSTFMTSDGISTGANESEIEHCFIYNGDNALVIGSTVKDLAFTDITIGTTCSAVFAQGRTTNAVLMNDIYVFRVGEGVFSAYYNPSEAEFPITYTFNNLDCIDMTYMPYFFKGANMRSAEKHITFNNVSTIQPLGVEDPHTSLNSRSKGTRYFFNLASSGSKNPSENWILDFKNLYVGGELITSADQLDNDGRQRKNTITFTSDGKYTGSKRNGQTVNWTAPNRVYAGQLQLIFREDVKKDGTTWLLPAEEIKTLLRKPEAKVTTVKKDGIEYIKSTDLVSAGLAKSISETDGGSLVIQPLYDGENLLLPDSGEISRWTELNCHQVNLVTKKDDDGLYYSLVSISGATAGMTRYFQDEAKMYGAGKYKLTFKVRADEAGIVTAGYATETSNFLTKSCNAGPNWTEYSFEFTVKEEEAAAAISLRFSPRASSGETPYLKQFDIRDITLTRIGE